MPDGYTPYGYLGKIDGRQSPRLSPKKSFMSFSKMNNR